MAEAMAGWRNAAIMAGHWVLHGFGMFVVEGKASGKFVGRVGPFSPPARRLGALDEGETMLLGHPVDLWVTRRSAWRG